VGLLANYGYDSLGRRTSVAFGNGTSRTYGWDSLNRLANVQQTFPNAAGLNQTINGSCTVNAVPAICYNPSSQIVGILHSNNAYAFSGVYDVNRTYGVNGLNQYTTSGSVALGYDARGNLNASGTSNFTYSKQNELISAPNATFYYDPSGRLMELTPHPPRASIIVVESAGQLMVATISYVAMSRDQARMNLSYGMKEAMPRPTLPTSR
jgi:hypothetical protein